MTAPIVSQEREELLTPFMSVMRVWARWIRLDDHKHSGGHGHPQDTKELMWTGEAVEVMINDLPRVQWWAIRKQHGVSPAVWRFPDTSMEDALEQAEATLTPKMRCHIDTARYFN